ncbi:hypothetical protein SprV_0301147800 [Sparganum proliferum]
MVQQGNFEKLSETTADKAIDLAQIKPARRREVKIGAAIHEACWIVAAEAKRDVHRSQMTRLHNANSQLLPTCPQCQRTFARIGLVGHLRVQCTNKPTTPTSPTTLASTVNPAPTTSVTDDNTAAAPPPSITDIILPAATPALTSSANTTTSRTPFTDGTTPDVHTP